MKIKRNSVFSTESSTIQLGRAAKYWRKYNWPTTEHTITTPTTRVSGYSLSSANASGGKSGGGPHTNNNFVIDVNDPEEMGQVERNIKKRMARRDGLMRQVWNEIVLQNQAFNNTTITKKTCCTCQHLSLCLFESVLQIHILSEYCQTKWQVVKWGIKYRNFYSVLLVHCFQTAESVFLNVNFQIFPCLTNYFQLCVKISPSCIWL